MVNRFVFALIIGLCAAQSFAQIGYYDSGGPLMPEQAAYDVTFYELNLRIDPTRQTIAGSNTIHVKVVDPLQWFVLDLDTLLKVDSVLMEQPEKDLKKLPFERRRGKLWIDVLQQMAPGQELAVKVYYGGKPRRAPYPPWEGGFSWARTKSGAHFIGVSCQLEGADIWWPCKDHPSDEPDSVALHFTVPADLFCASNGRLLSIVDNDDNTRTFNWFVSTPINNYGVTINVSDYQQIHELYQSVAGDTIPVTFWVKPENYSKAEELFPKIIRDLNFLEQTLGPYPFRADKYGVAEAPFLGMEHQTLIAYGSTYTNGVFGYDYGFDALHFHELAHEWFGNLVTAADWKDLWIHEGFATYMEAMYAGHLQGKDAYHELMQFFRLRVRNLYPVAPEQTKSMGQMYGTDIYYKGACILHTLRYLIGEKAFTTALRQMAYPDSTFLLATDGRQCRLVSSEDFIRIAEKVSGRDLGWFFDVYLRNKNLPRLYANTRNNLLRLHWEAPNGRPFPMPVQVKLNKKVHRLDMSDGYVELNIPPGVEPVIDPQGWILKDLVRSVDVKLVDDKSPERFALEQNYPNPFNASTTIQFSIASSCQATLDIFNTLGEHVKTLLSEHLAPGYYQAVLDASDLSSGIYVYRLQADRFIDSKKFTLVK